MSDAPRSGCPIEVTTSKMAKKPKKRFGRL